MTLKHLILIQHTQKYTKFVLAQPPFSFYGGIIVDKKRLVHL